MSDEFENAKQTLMPMIDKMCADLCEHVDSVQIFITKKTEDGKGSTITLTRGMGDWYARYGFVAYWLKEQEGYAQERGRSMCKDDNS